MGGATLDFREARLPEGEVEIRVGALMGGVEIIVPPTLAVESNGAAIMGGFEHVDRAPATAEPGTHCAAHQRHRDDGRRQHRDAPARRIQPRAARKRRRKAAQRLSPPAELVRG